jgi:3-oxoadipate enol-lactonase
MPLATLNDVDLYYESEGDGPALVFCHGADGNHLSWWQQVPAFRDRYRCNVFDHRGFGASRAAEGAGGDGHYVADMHALVDHLGLPDVRLVGHSMGNRTALGYALAHPERVTAVVSLAGIGSFAEPRINQRVADSRAAGNLGEDFIGSLAPEFPQREPARAFLYQQIVRLNPKRPAGPTQAPIGPDDLRTMQVPTLFIAGEHDFLMPPDVLREVAGYVPGSRFELIRGVGHGAHVEQPEVFNRLLRGFLDGVE